MSPWTRRLPLAMLGPALALLLAQCTADPLNVVILNARAPGDKCDFTDPTLFVERGSLDFTPWVSTGGAAGQSVYYGQAFSWENQMLPLPITVNGQIVDPGGGNDFIGDTIVYSYQYTGPGVTLANETQNIRASITAAATADKNFMGAQLIQPQAAAALDAALTLDGTPQTLLVTFQMFGKTVAGVGKSTNPVSFPLTVYKNSNAPVICNPSPTDGGVATRLFEGPCGEPGRDSPVQCVVSQ